MQQDYVYALVNNTIYYRERIMHITISKQGWFSLRVTTNF